MTIRTRPQLAVVGLIIGAAALVACGNIDMGLPPPSSSGPTALSAPGSTTGSVQRPVSGTVPAAQSPAPATETNPAGDIPDTQAFVPFSPASGGFSVKVPEGWARTASGTGVLFTDKYNSVLIEPGTNPKAPTVQSGRTDLTQIGRGATGFVPGPVSMVSRTAGKAVLITYRADSPPNPVTGKVVVESVERYKFWSNGRSVVLTLSAPLGSDNVDPWRTVTNSFRWAA